MPLSKVLSGLLFAEDWTNLASWISAGVWTATADPMLLAFDPSPLPLLTHGTGGSSDATGVREGQLYVEGNVWYLVYDGGDGTTGWLQHYRTSTDRGLTWSAAATLGPGYNKGGGGTYAAVATGWLEKRGSTYYLYRVTAGTTFASPNTGLPGSPYGGDVWSATSIGGTWTWVRDLPLTGWSSTQDLPGSVYFDGTTYYIWTQGDSDQLGFFTATSIGGTWTQHSPTLVPGLINGRSGENPKVFYHPVLARYIMLANLIAPAGTYTDQNWLVQSTAVDFSASPVGHIIQHVSPLDTPNALGLMTHSTGPDGALVVDADGSMGAVYDGLAENYSPGWHIGRTLRGVVLEPSASCARFTNTGSAAPFRMTNPTYHADFVAEWACEFRTLDASNGYLVFEFRRQDNANYYAVTMHPGAGMKLYKYVAGVQSTLQNPLASTELPVLSLVHRLRVVVAGTRIQAWCNGELQIDIIDTTYASGLSVAFVGAKMDGDVRRFSLRKSQTISVQGVGAGTVVTLRGAGGIPFATGVGPDPVFTVAHSPLSSIDIGGASYDLGGTVYGGDVYSLSGTYTPLFFN